MREFVVFLDVIQDPAGLAKVQGRMQSLGWKFIPGDKGPTLAEPHYWVQLGHGAQSVWWVWQWEINEAGHPDWPGLSLDWRKRGGYDYLFGPGETFPLGVKIAKNTILLPEV